MATRRQFILATDADRSGIESLIQVDKPAFALTTPAYTLADPAPRPVTHWVTDFTQTTPLPSIETPGTGCKDVFPDSKFEEHFIPPVSPPYTATRLAELGLTQNQN